MPPSPRSTVRLPHALDARFQARVQAGMPFAVLMREALSAYLADTRRHRSAPSPAAPSGVPERSPASAADRQCTD